MFRKIFGQKNNGGYDMRTTAGKVLFFGSVVACIIFIVAAINSFNNKEYWEMAMYIFLVIVFKPI